MPKPVPRRTHQADSATRLAAQAPRTETPSVGGLSTHILPASATMIGVCMTLLSIGHIGPPGEMRWLIDKLLAMDALLFLASALLSFMSMRAELQRARLELLAEWVFMVGLSLLALVGLVLAFAIS